MKVPVRNRTGRLGVNLTPLIDIIFLLIIFFLVAGHFVRNEAFHPVALPQAGNPNTADTNAAGRVTVTVSNQGSYYIDGRPASVEMADRRIRAAVQAEQQGGHALRIRADAEADFGAVRPLLEAAASYGVKEIQFAVQEEESSGSP